MGELKNTQRDTVKAIASSGIVCCVFFWVVPFSFQGVLGPEGVLVPGVADGWIHRINSPHIERPWKAPTALIAFNTFLAYVNGLFLGAGVKAWGYPSALWIGFVVGSLIFPVFAFRP